ncbi:Alkyltransferase-like protein 1 [Conoideocrella luteorostrata]|uniref:Alkyltransferase-like protein 1 n=1 Tax=Conoideocrella luteorostrata TaxID=1105319 RepID=A0AAJ0CW41_9HYPO|nr:Alkyltransferase-like protein 1 [Conoideocrella luteorostrata]
MPRSDEAAAFFHAVYSAVQEIPFGKVTSYGHIAMLVGTQFKSYRTDWIWMLTGRGEQPNALAKSASRPEGAQNQAEALRVEGVEVTRGALGELMIDFGEYGWFPRVLPSEAVGEEAWESSGGSGSGSGSGDEEGK